MTTITAPVGPPPTRARRLALAALRRTASLLLVLLLTATLTFTVLEVAGGDRVAAILGPNAVVDEATRQAVIAQYGLDRPVWLRYIDYLGGLVVGDFGQSYVQRRPVAEVVATGIGPTVELAVSAAVIAIMLAGAVGLATDRSRPVARLVAQFFELVLVSTPTFWLGIVLLTVFGFGLRWFPVWGDQGWQSLVLPAFALGLPIAAMLSQVVRDSADKTHDEPFVLSVRARGVSDARLRLVHVLKHAASPALNVAGLVIGGLLGGAVLTESVFGRPGLGSIALQAITNRDLPVVMAVVLLSAAVYVVVSTLTDVVQTTLDPRATGGRRSST